jgi:hypothetical protein
MPAIVKMTANEICPSWMRCRNRSGEEYGKGREYLEEVNKGPAGKHCQMTWRSDAVLLL